MVHGMSRPQALGAFLAAVLPSPAWAQSGGDEAWNWHMHDGWGHMMGWGLFGGFGMLLFWGVIIVLAVLLVRGVMGGRSDRARPASGSRALDILQERYARGEIGKDEYDERRRTLMDS